MSGHFIDVILPIPIQKTFTYSVTQYEYEFLKKGMRVAVSFGKTKMYTALVFKLHQIPPETYDAKEILQILDNKPIVTEHQLKHWEWISTYYMCGLGDVYRAALPSALELVSDRETHTPAEEKMVQAVVGNCMAQGIIIGATNRSVPGYNNTLCLSPALISTKDDLDQITSAMDKAITEVFG